MSPLPPCPHGDRDAPLPCPYPDCPRAVPGLRLIVPIYIPPAFIGDRATATEKVYRRSAVRWIDGTLTYDWVPEDAPREPILSFWSPLAAVIRAASWMRR